MIALFLLFQAISLRAESLDFAVDGLLAKVGSEAVLQSDLHRFKQVKEVLACAKIFENAEDQKAKPDLLENYIEEELMYLEARSRRLSTAGQVQKAVQSIHGRDACKSKWQSLGKSFSEFYRTESRLREGESLLVKELEKRILVQQLRSSGGVTDTELWKRELRAKFPVKVYAQ